MTPAARLAAAIDLLADIEAAPQRPADAVANDFFRNRRYIGSGDRRAISSRVWTIVRTWRRLEWWLRGDTAPRLRVAASILLEGWSLSAVQQAFSGGRYAPASLGPAETTRLRPLEGRTLEDPDMPQAVRLEVPDWLFPHFAARFGPCLEAEARALLAEAPLDLRVNTLKATRDEARAALAAEGIAAEPTLLSPWGLRIADRLPITSGVTFRDGRVEIQDEGSQLVALLADARPGMHVADWCAGAGGKTLAMAAAMQNRGHIVACDVSASRLDAAIRRLRRAGVHNVECRVTESGDRWAKRRAGTFDRVLVDAPCTGTGTWRRDPDARLRLIEAKLHELSAKQAAILDVAASLCRVGGRLVYATCSLLSAEDEMQVNAFLTRRPEFRRLSSSAVWPGTPTEGDLHLTPARHGTDGFYCAVLERAA